MLRRLAFVLTLVFLVAYAYSPLFQAGLLGSDLRTLVDVGRIAWPAERGSGSFELFDLYTVHGVEGRPLAALWLTLESRLLTDGGRWTGAEVTFLRLANVTLLVLAAWGVARILRRGLAPWTGADGARAAGYACAALFLLHPLCVDVVARPANAGTLLGLVLGALATHAFLKSRHERRISWAALAVALVILCGLASELATFVALVLALIEITVERRNRPMHVRLRTTGTTLLVFASAASVELALRAAVGAPIDPPRIAAVWLAQGDGPTLAEAARVGIEKLGILIMPVRPEGLGAFGYVLGGAALLLALEPALVAARSAPRLWGSLLGLWCIALFLVELSTAGERVDPDTFAHVATLFPAVVVMAAGLGVSSTALSGLRRGLLPVLSAASFAIVAHATALPWISASSALSELRADLDRAREELGRDGTFLVLDPPGRVGGLDVLEGELDVLLDPALTGEPEDPELRGLGTRAFLQLVRQPEYDALRRGHLSVVFPAALLADVRLPGDDGRGLGRVEGLEVRPRSSTARAWLRIASPAPSQGSVVWRGEARSGLLDIDPLVYPLVRVTASPDTTTATRPRAWWRGSEARVHNAFRIGAWVEGLEGPVGLIDTAGSLPWALAGRVRRVWLDGVLARPLSAEILADLPEPAEVVRERYGDDWRFLVDTDGLPRPLSGETTWRLALLDLSTFDDFEVDLVEDADGALRALGANTFVDRALRTGGPLAWSLDLVVGGTTIARRADRIER